MKSLRFLTRINDFWKSISRYVYVPVADATQEEEVVEVQTTPPPVVTIGSTSAVFKRINAGSEWHYVNSATGEVTPFAREEADAMLAFEAGKTIVYD
jgi:hypothetical protein